MLWTSIDPETGRTYLDAVTDLVLQRTSFKHAPWGSACAVDAGGEGKCRMLPSEILRVDVQHWLQQRWGSPDAMTSELGKLTTVAVGPLFDVWWMGWNTVARGPLSSGATFEVVDNRMSCWNPITLRVEQRATTRRES